MGCAILSSRLTCPRASGIHAKHGGRLEHMLSNTDVSRSKYHWLRAVLTVGLQVILENLKRSSGRDIMGPDQRKSSASLLLVSAAIIVSASALPCPSQAAEPAPLIIREQGSLAVAGTVISHPGTFDPNKQTPEGQTFHGDHAYVFYQIPVNARKFPLVLWHGAGQFSKTWETTPDGREGYQNIFLHHGFAVYVIDQPRRGNAVEGCCEPSRRRCHGRASA